MNNRSYKIAPRPHHALKDFRSVTFTILTFSYIKELLLCLNQVFALLDLELQFVNLLHVVLPGNNIIVAQGC